MNRSKFSHYLMVLAGAAVAFAFATPSARAEMGAVSPGQAQSQAQSVSPAVVTTIQPYYTATDAGHVAEGCGLRNSRNCAINLRGIPAKSKVKKAFLYWAYTSTTGAGTGRTKHITLNGVYLKGTLVGNGYDACWFGGTNVVYRATVTRIVRHNGKYTVVIPKGATPLHDGSDPWQTSEAPSAKQGLAEGASIVAIYTNANETGTTLVYDAPLSGTEFDGGSTGPISYSLGGVPSPGPGASIFTEIGSDGQIGSSYAAQGLTGKPTTFNGTIIAGSGGVDSDSDWDGTDGTSLNQLWDTHTHDVSGLVTSGTDSVSIDPGYDCLIGVANVLTVR